VVQLVTALVLVLVTVLAAVVTAAPATAADLGITLVHLRSTRTELDVVCNPDPPVDVLVYLGDHETFVGKAPVACAGGGATQRVVVAIDRTLAVGTHVTLSATVSGDSGEINATFPDALVEADAPPPAVTVPSAPRRLHARVCSRRATLSWRAPARTGGAAVDRYRARRPGHVRVLPAGTRSVTFTHLRGRHRYALHVSAHNSAGWSRAPGMTVVTSRAGHGCHTAVVTASRQ
jgi:hypothetical protein